MHNAEEEAVIELSADLEDEDIEEDECKGEEKPPLSSIMQKGDFVSWLKAIKLIQITVWNTFTDVTLD